MPIPDRTARYREEYRRDTIPARYSGRLHLAATTSASLLVAAFAISRVVAPTTAELAALPLMFLVANAGEYFGHRGPMHHRLPGLRKVFERHTLRHHRFYVDGAMESTGDRDYHITLFPPVLLSFFLLGIAAPLAGLLFWLTTANLGWLFLATVALYLVTYEWLHLSWHSAPDSRLGSLPGVAALRRHHGIHHDPKCMLKHNFNISFPVFDMLMSTRRRDGDAEVERAAP